MHQYVTAAEYRDWPGATIPDSVTDSELDTILQASSFKVDQLTFNRIQDYSKLYPRQQELVTLATMYEANYLYGVQQSGGFDSAIAGFSVTDVSVSFNSDRSGALKWLEAQYISRIAYNMLESTGLMWRGR